jgi:disintegrin and metalloproteinase domain-containing protein 17
VCEKTVQDVVERLWDIIKDININRVTVFLRDNIVCTVILVTAIIWIPASCAISCVDRRRRNAQEKSAKWMNSNEIYRDDSGHLINTNVPQQRPPTAAVLQDLDNRKQT